MLRISTGVLMIIFCTTLNAQEIILRDKASVKQVFQDEVESQNALPMDEVGVDFGYILYRAEITTSATESTTLTLENVRDYAAVYVDDYFQGTLTDKKKKIVLNCAPGLHKLELYVENIGRITYGPEILDNSKGIFGNVTVGQRVLENWVMIPLNIREMHPDNLNFDMTSDDEYPGFYKGFFEFNDIKNVYLDVSGWGMGEVWINGHYLGSYWEEEKQQSIQIQADLLNRGKNELVVFELKKIKEPKMRLSAAPVFN
ncbi:hypothetical protein [Sphingobacterium sp. LRF_L2]|uniref:hypothetical protein n=1 Tax=Sphingobacterium sp. LRF_L2 TaxID=3369421 RepID=UPI003F5ED497